MQTKLAQYYSKQLSEALGAKVTISQIHFKFFDSLSLKDLYVEDLHQDTLLFAESIDADVEGFYLNFTQLDFDDVKLNNSIFKVKQYAGEEDLSIQFIVDFFDPPKKIKKPKTGKDFELFFWDVDLNNVTFEFKNLEQEQGNNGYLMNYDDLRFNNITGNIQEFRIIGDSLSGKIKNLKFNEKCGLAVQQLKTDLIIAYTTMSLYNTTCITNRTSLEGDFRFDYEKYAQLSDFVEKVYLKTRIKKSVVYLDDLKYFSSEIEGFEMPLVLSGRCRGTIKNLEGVNVNLIAGDNRFFGNFNLSGLPNIDSTLFDLQIKELNTSHNGLSQIPNYPFKEKQKISIPKEINRFGTIVYSGRLMGYLSDFYTSGKLYSGLGDVDLKTRLTYSEDIQDYRYKGNLKTIDFAIGNLLQSGSILDRIAIETEFDGSSFSAIKAQVQANGVIDRFDFNQYLANNIKFNLNLSNQKLEGAVIANDAQADFSFNGFIDFKSKNAISNFEMDIERLNLSALRLVSLDSELIIKSHVFANMVGTDIDELDGVAGIENCEIQLGTYQYDLKKFIVTASKTGTFESLNISSDLVDVKIDGDYTLKQFSYYIGRTLNNYLPSYTLIKLGKEPVNTESQSISYNVNIKDFTLLSKLFDIPLAFNGKNEIWGHYNSESDWIRLKMQSDGFKVMDYQFDQSTIDAHNTTGLLELNFSSKNLHLNDSISMFNINLKNQINRDTAGIQLVYSNHPKDSESADIRANAQFEGAKINLTILPSYILIGDSVWIVNEGNEIEIDTGRIFVKNLSLEHNEQFARINGAVSKNRTDELDVILSNFRLSTFNPIFKDEGFSIRGRADGFVSLSNLYDKPIIKSDLNILRFGLNDEIFGTLKVKNQWYNENQSIGVVATLSSQELPSLDITGRIFPYKKDNNLNLDVSLDRFRLAIVKNYLKDIFSNIDGYASGKIEIDGSLAKPQMNGVVNIKRGRMTIGYLNTTYTFANEDLVVTSSEISMKNCNIADTEGSGTGKVNFMLKHQNFKNISFNTTFDFNRLQALNTNETMNELFYGKAFATGTAAIYGDLDHITFDIKARTDKGTIFSLPLYGASEISQDNFIVFINKQDTLQTQANKKKSQTVEGFTLNMLLDVTPDATAELIFDPTVGDKIQAKGKGNLQILLTPDGKFQLFGDYVIQNGDYLFTLENIVSKRFSVETGSSIVWYGDPLNANVNINAIYKLQTPLFPIVQQFDTSDIRRKPVQVEAVLTMKKKLLTPDLGFEIRLPNSDQVSRDLLASQIQTENELNKQFFGLLVLGQFLPNVGGIGESASINSTIGSNAREFLSSQISNWLSKLSDDVNIGVNYRQNGATGGDQVNVSVSKQFNDRVSVDGNVGVINGNSKAVNNSNNNFVGEFNIEYKVTEDGRFRIRAFNRSNQYNLVTNDFPYTQGVSLFYRREFEDFSDLFKKKPVVTVEPK